MRRSLMMMLIALMMLSPLATAVAQEDTPAAPSASPGVNAEDPADRIVAHIEEMTKIVKDNKAAPDELLKKFEAYLAQNTSKMQAANKDFEARLKAMSPDDSKKYQETLQRKLEKPMQDFLTAMLDFQKSHPDKAKALDERLYKMTQKQ